MTIATAAPKTTTTGSTARRTKKAAAAKTADAAVETTTLDTEVEADERRIGGQGGGEFGQVEDGHGRGLSTALQTFAGALFRSK